MNVLVVDDSAATRERLVDMVSQLEGIEVALQAQNGLEALSHVNEFAPDVVIMDIRMPGTSGINVLARIKEGRPRPVVIMLTNYTYPQYRQVCVKLGADYFLDKTTEFERIPRILADLINNTMKRPTQTSLAGASP